MDLNSKEWVEKLWRVTLPSIGLDSSYGEIWQALCHKWKEYQSHLSINMKKTYQEAIVNAFTYLRFMESEHKQVNEIQIPFVFQIIEVFPEEREELHQKLVESKKDAGFWIKFWLLRQDKISQETFEWFLLKAVNDFINSGVDDESLTRCLASTFYFHQPSSKRGSNPQQSSALSEYHQTIHDVHKLVKALDPKMANAFKEKCFLMWVREYEVKSSHKGWGQYQEISNLSEQLKKWWGLFERRTIEDASVLELALSHLMIQEMDDWFDPDQQDKRYLELKEIQEKRLNSNRPTDHYFLGFDRASQSKSFMNQWKDKYQWYRAWRDPAGQAKFLRWIEEKKIHQWPKEEWRTTERSTWETFEQRWKKWATLHGELLKTEPFEESKPRPRL